MWKDQLFWFSQPATQLNVHDNYLLWLFAGIAIVGIVLKISFRFLKHPVIRKLLNRFSNAGLVMGLVGLIWFGMRYENAQIFSYRYWAALVIIILVIWLVFIFKYWLTNFRSEKQSYDRMLLNSKYIPGSKK